MKRIRIIELFAGVGGFRLGFERASNGVYQYDVVWSNQFEPSTKIQHASDVYVQRFGDKNHSNVDISKVDENDIPEHDLLVGGFPCQDYSVAKILSHAQGIVGQKGVLWWEIYRIVKAKKPSYILLENVDRLIKSPAPQRGRDFAVMLKTLSDLGYDIEWRVINASDYGMPQRRRRVFIYAYRSSSTSAKDIIFRKGLFAKSFSLSGDEDNLTEIALNQSLQDISDNFGKGASISAFQNAGCVIKNKAFTTQINADYSGGEHILLKDVLQKEKEVPQEYYVEESELKKWEYLKGGKREERFSKDGRVFVYCEGAMSFPDSLDKPARTIVTGEGGKTPSRFKHVIKTAKGYRRLTPVELERLNMFPDNHTAGSSDAKRAFLMGNALVIGIVERFAKSLGQECVGQR